MRPAEGLILVIDWVDDAIRGVVEAIDGPAKSTGPLGV
jgi:hypothetical protein